MRILARVFNRVLAICRRGEQRHCRDFEFESQRLGNLAITCRAPASADLKPEYSRWTPITQSICSDELIEC